MTKTLIVGPHAERLEGLLKAEDVGSLEVTTETDPGAAQQAVKGAEVLFGPPDLLAELMPHCDAIRWVQSSWAGLRPMIAQPRRDFVLTGLKEIFGRPVSEFVLGWLLALERNILMRAEARAWLPEADESVAGKRLGILGAGSIGTELASVAAAFGMEVVGCSRSGAASAHFDAMFDRQRILDFADGLHYLVAVLPETPETDDLIDADMLGRLRAGAIVINVGRGNSLVEEDLLASLESGQVRAAVLDVLRVEPLPADDPLWTAPGVYITSHTSAPTVARAAVKLFAENARRFCAGRTLLYQVDFEQGY
ncbi:MAG: D-2-hydroxyacid dehydrogenase [Pseudomonadota bacterium]